MPRRVIEVDGERWTVSVSGRITQYVKDEFGLVFARGSGSARERRVARYSPQNTKSPELALAGLSDADLAALLSRSQPAWTAPETGYLQ
jgi:hypothetical protein